MFISSGSSSNELSGLVVVVIVVSEIVMSTIYEYNQGAAYE